MMPNSDPRDRFFYPHHTLMKDTYNLAGKHRSRVVRYSRSWNRKSPDCREIETGLCHPTAENPFLFTPAVNGSLLCFREEDSGRRGMDSVFHMLCSRCSGPLTPAVPTAVRL